MADPKFFPTKHKSSNVAEVGKCADGHLYVKFHSGAVYRWDGLAGDHRDALIDDFSPASIEVLEVEIAKSFEPAAYIQAMLEKSYRETAAIIFANTMNEASVVPRQNILNSARPKGQ